MTIDGSSPRERLLKLRRGPSTDGVRERCEPVCDSVLCGLVARLKGALRLPTLSVSAESVGGVYAAI